MAIYSFNHDSFGKTTNRAGAAGDNAAYNARENETRLGKSNHDTFSSAASNAAYNAREEATHAVRSHIIPPNPKEAEAWFRQQEQGERKNARMSDRFIGALPRELTPEQCIEAVESFCREVTQDRIPWHFALHLELDKKNEPDWNPHAHIIFRDRDIDTGRRFLYTSAGPKERAELAAKGIEPWTTRDFREKWGEDMNHALERAGHDARIDHRTLREQGIDRTPQIHIGPGSQNAAEKGHQFESQDRLRADRTIPYSLLDAGSRAEHNARIVEANKQRQAEKQPTASRQHPEHPNLRDAQGEVRLAMYREQKRDRDVLRQAHTVQLDQLKAWAKILYADARKSAFEQVREQTDGKWQAVRAIEAEKQRDQAAAALKLEQKNLYAKASTLHVGQARIEKDQAWQALKHSQMQERLDLRNTHREEYAALTRQHVAERLGISEEHKTQQLQKDANRISARFGANQGMAPQQKAAVQTMRLRHKAGAPDSAKAFLQTAHVEHDRRGKIRDGLNAKRQTNQLRSLTPDRFRSQAGRAMDPLSRTLQPDPKTQARQAAASGQTLFSEERANAPKDVKERLDRQDRKTQGEKSTSGAKQQQRGKGRDGGGRGR